MSTDGMSRVHLVVGTRPEAVKVAPMVGALRHVGLRPSIIDTGQQSGRVNEALTPFALSADIELGIRRRDGSLAELISLTSMLVNSHLAATQPDAVLVQGDTTTALIVGLMAHLRRIPVIHLEAGLRTYDQTNPFPEETNRRLLADLADLQLAPTWRARESLLSERVPRERIIVTGNTIVDALSQLPPTPATRTWPGPRLVVTVHRREAWGAGVRTVATAVRRLLAQLPELRAIVVTHPNPAVAADVHAVLKGVERCELLPPQRYDSMLSLLRSADVVLTDSGGIQEEAPSLGVRVVVARETTERPEGVEAGWAVLAGLDEDRIVKEVTNLLDAGRPVSGPANPYGDGHAAQRAAQAVAWLLGHGHRPDDWAGPLQ
jgi:UDP-N-acetylglucosamine 2-epimerase (non-hydrolysing)